MYFWIVAKEGSIARACDRLALAQPTISHQLRRLEKSFGAALFDRSGRNLTLTEFGQTVLQYADAIFTIGRDLQDAISGEPGERSRRLVVGMPDVLPKHIAYRLLRPALDMRPVVHLVCHEGRHHDLLSELALHRLDLVLSDSPVTPVVNVRAFNHLLGECGLSFFATAELASHLRKGFPGSLNHAPLLLPTERTAVRRELEQWFYQQDVQPRIVGEFEDTALMSVFAQDGLGVFAAPTVIERETCRQYGVRVVGRIDSVRERYYAISLERRLRHPAVVAIREFARVELFK
jgi:LysR family transcriptional activator of nhaA